MLKRICILVLCLAPCLSWGQGGSFTPAQQAWLFSVFGKNTNVYIQASINASNWVSWRTDNTNLIAYMYSRTDDWDRAAVDAIFATNAVATLTAALDHPRTGIWGMNTSKELVLLSIISESAAGFCKMDTNGHIVVSSNWWTDAWFVTNVSGEITARTLP
jgi:hypothetical protein